MPDAAPFLTSEDFQIIIKQNKICILAPYLTMIEQMCPVDKEVPWRFSYKDYQANYKRHITKSSNGPSDWYNIFA